MGQAALFPVLHIYPVVAHQRAKPGNPSHSVHVEHPSIRLLPPILECSQQRLLHRDNLLRQLLVVRRLTMLRTVPRPQGLDLDPRCLPIQNKSQCLLPFHRIQSKSRSRPRDFLVP